ncbi:hypothetical protein KUTeg_006154 [Tegillarca granosa]|uniref:Uncharacterized protein n=1 Tax=Tegillarca granosa TaxID=220873 RepID=A0ABQ9FKE1_TEGGR|nr:hypothetical protein KUTeg_006154 [Tegillarca granosa]
MKSFAKHYDSSQGGVRTPYVITIDPSWMKDNNKKDGTVQFLEYVRAAFDDHTLTYTPTAPVSNIKDIKGLVKASIDACC